MTEPGAAPFRILSITGGGLFAHAQARVLSAVGDDLLKNVAAFAGTSAGGILAILASMGGLPFARCGDFFPRYANSIFPGYSWRRFLMQWATAKYPDRQFNALLQRYIAGRFGDARVPTFIVSHDLQTGRPRVWSSVDDEDGDIPAWEIARMTAAAHTYFPPWRWQADGGVYANDPVMCGITGAMRKCAAHARDIQVFSLGSGYEVTPPRNRLPRNKLDWLKVLLADTLTSGDIARFQARAMLGDARYKHIEFGERRGMEMDNPAVPAMIDRHWKPQIEVAIARLRQFLTGSG